ncbi:hypothetical protein OK016_24995 [Vibrio chagasii]|nr:hypothetical protein [Vibrio chagasii]
MDTNIQHRLSHSVLMDALRLNRLRRLHLQRNASSIRVWVQRLVLNLVPKTLPLGRSRTDLARWVMKRRITEATKQPEISHTSVIFSAPTNLHYQCRILTYKAQQRYSVVGNLPNAKHITLVAVREPDYHVWWRTANQRKATVTTVAAWMTYNDSTYALLSRMIPAAARFSCTTDWIFETRCGSGVTTWHAAQ